MNFNKICVLGLGYIGLPTASTFATNGLKVIGVDVNKQVIQSLRNGNIHIHEPGLRTLVQAAFRSGNLVINETPEEADAYIIAVPTPFHSEQDTQKETIINHADMRYVVSATESIVPYLQPGNLVILESTSPPRTTIELVAPILERSGLKAGKDFYLAYSPERVLPGQILREIIENARVIGGINQSSSEAGRELYSLFVRGEIVMTDATTAEMVKLMENTYRDINIAVANEFARLADRFQVNISEAISLANRHPRVKILKPGVGVGGHCISVDPWFLVEAASDITALIQASRKVNDSQPEFVCDLIRRAAGGSLKGKKITALGLTYKADVDDMRESPAVDVVTRLADSGADVTAFEPFKPQAQIEHVNMAKSLEDAVKDAEILVLLVGHKQLIKQTPESVRKLTKANIVLDIAGAWDLPAWESAGYKMYGLWVPEDE